MSPSHVYTLSGKYMPVNRTKIIENFGVSIGNKNSQSDSTIVKDTKKIQETIDENTVIKGCASLLTNVLTSVAAKNEQNLVRLFSASNRIDISGVKGKNFSLTKMNQTTTISLEQSEEINQQISTKLMQDINNTLKSEIDTMVNDKRERESSEDNLTQQATNLGSTLESLASTVGDTASKLLDVSIGNSTDIDKSVEINTEFNKEMKLEKNFTLEKDDSIASQLENQLSMENISNAIQETKSGNELELSNLDTSGDVKIFNVEQKAAIDAVLANIFDQTILTEISTKIVTMYDKNVSNMIISADKEAVSTSTASTSGDLFAAGVAGKQVLQGAGEAAKGIGYATANVAEETGEAVSEAAQGFGKGVATALRAMAIPLLIGGLVLVLVGIIYTYAKKKGYF